MSPKNRIRLAALLYAVGLYACGGGSGGETNDPAPPDDSVQAPTVSSITIETEQDTPVSSELTGHDANGMTLAFELVSGPFYGTASVSVDGTFTYTPQTGWAGTDSFEFRATNGMRYSEPGVVTVTIRQSANFGQYGSPEALQFIPDFIAWVKEEYGKSQYETEQEYQSRVSQSFDASTVYFLRVNDPSAFVTSYDAEQQNLVVHLGQRGCKRGDNGEPCFPDQAIFLQHLSGTSTSSSTHSQDGVIFTDSGDLAAGSSILFSMSPTKAESIEGTYGLVFPIRFFPLPAYDSDTVLSHLISHESYSIYARASGWRYGYYYEGPFAIIDDAILFDLSTGEQIAIASGFLR